MKFIRNWKISLPVAGAVLVGLAWLAFGFFGIHTAFIDDEVSEAAPEFDAPSAPAEPVSADEQDPTGGDSAAGEPQPEPVTVATSDVTDDAPVATHATDTDTATDATDTAESGSADEPAESAPVTGTEPPADNAPQAEEAVEAVEAEAAPAETVPEIVMEASGSFSGTSRYDVSGDAIVLGNGTGQRFLRFEEFESSNGPDLNVYLFNPNDSSDFVDLGDLKGNIGEQNYEIPADVDLSVYSEVSIWCVRFGTGFGSADLVAA